MNRLFIRVITPLLLMFVVIIGVHTYLHSYQSVTINAPVNSQISLYKGSVSEDSYNYSQDDPVMTTTSTLSKKIKKGGYVYIVKPTSDDYNTIISSVEVEDKQLTIAPALAYTTKRLDYLASSSYDLIKASLVNEYPKTMSSFTINKVKTFGDGTWFGVVLKPTDNSIDTYLAVIQKDKYGAMKIVTKPPSLIISSTVYPQIPKDIVSAINRLVATY